MKRSIGLRAQPARSGGDGGAQLAERLEAPVTAPARGSRRLEVWRMRPRRCRPRRRSWPQGRPSRPRRVSVAISGAGSFDFGGIWYGFAVVDRVDQQALPGVARHDRRARSAAREDRRTRVEPQVALLLGRPVTALASRRQQRPDALLEELDGRRVRRRGLRGPPSRPDAGTTSKRDPTTAAMAVAAAGRRPGSPRSDQSLIPPISTGPGRLQQCLDSNLGWAATRDPAGGRPRGTGGCHRIWPGRGVATPADGPPTGSGPSP